MRAIAGAILIHAGCSLMGGNRPTDDLGYLPLLPVLLGALLILGDLISGLLKRADPTKVSKSD